MGKVGLFTSRVILPVVLFIVSILGIGAYGLDNQNQQTDTKRSDVIIIDMLKTHGRLECPGVEFPHDLHTQALKKIQKDCTACHLPEKDRLSLKFQRTIDESKPKLQTPTTPNVLNVILKSLQPTKNPVRSPAENATRKYYSMTRFENPSVLINPCMPVIPKPQKINAKFAITNMTLRLKNCFTPKRRKVPAAIAIRM